MTKNRFKLLFEHNVCSLIKNNVIVAHERMTNGLYVLITLSSMYNIERTKKRGREEVNMTYLWHCPLGHVSEKRINKLHK